MSRFNLYAPATSRENGDFKEITSTSLGGSKHGLDLALGGTASDGNSSTTILTSGSTFTGTGEQNNFDHVGVVVKSDVEGTLYFDFSGDGTNWDSTFPVQGFEVAAGITDYHTAVKLGRYFRVRFVNNGADQTYFRLYTYYGNNFIPSNQPLNQSVATDTDATITRPSSFEDEVVIGLRTGVRAYNKFGYRTGLTAANGEETVWAFTGSNNFTPLTAASTFTVTYTPASDGSTSNGAKTLLFDYIDANGLNAEDTLTLGSSGSDVTTFTGLGINRFVVTSTGSTQYNGADIIVTATTGGSNQAIIPAASGVTQQAIFFVDSNSRAIGKSVFFNVNKLSGGNPKVTIKGYVFNRAIATRFEIFRHTIDTSAENTVFFDEHVGFSLSPTDVLYWVADTDTNNAVITLRFSLREYKIS